MALHRARALARGLTKKAGKPILFTTHTKNDRVEVASLDRVAYRLVQTAEGTRPKLIFSNECEEIWEDIILDLGLPYSAGFLIGEWE